MGKAQSEGKEQEPGELDSQLKPCSGWQGTAGLGSVWQPGKAQGQIRCLSGTSRVGQWLSVPLAAHCHHPWLFLDISITPRGEELEHITAHTPDLCPWAPSQQGQCPWVPVPVPSLWWHHSIPSWAVGFSRCLEKVPLPRRDILDTLGRKDTARAGQGQARLRLGGRMDFTGEWGLGEGQRMPMENLREVRDMSQEQAPPEAHESLSHPSGDGRGAGGGLWSWAGQLHLLPHRSTSLRSQDMGKGCQAGLGLVAQAQQPELTPGQHWECWKETALQKLSAGQRNPSRCQRQEMPCTKANQILQASKNLI